MDTDAIFRKWFQAKRPFIENMNGRLISVYKFPVKFSFDELTKVSKVEDFIHRCSIRFQEYNLTNFLVALNTEDFFNNITSKEYLIRAYEGDRTITVPKNYKVIKAFKFFVEDKDDLRKLQDEASQIIQENTIQGTLCLSVHPLDFLSASENAHNWRSCHSLDGDYRTGNLNYLLDSSTVCCYLTPNEKVKLPNFPNEVLWNSKKWRVWLFFSNDMTMMFAGRQYPFETSQGLNFVKDNFLPSVGFGHWGDFFQKKISKISETNTVLLLDHTYVPVAGGLKPMDELIQEGQNTYMFNDLLRSTCYDPLYSFRLPCYLSTGSTTNSTVFNIGKSAPCPICGEGEIEHSEIFACSDCVKKFGIWDENRFSVCDICGEVVYNDDIIYLENSGYAVCQNCYVNETSTCDECGCADLNDFMTVEDGRCLCSSCAEQR